jgi:hypothetical protein
MIECPKCQGGAYLLDEELVKVLENTKPLKIIAKATYQCRSCAEKFSRLVYENLEERKRPPEVRMQPAAYLPPRQEPEEAAEGLQFLDTV